VLSFLFFFINIWLEDGGNMFLRNFDNHANRLDSGTTEQTAIQTIWVSVLREAGNSRVQVNSKLSKFSHNGSA
jgi:hypothetical protein